MRCTEGGRVNVVGPHEAMNFKIDWGHPDFPHVVLLASLCFFVYIVRYGINTIAISVSRRLRVCKGEVVLARIATMMRCYRVAVRTVFTNCINVM